MSKITPIKAKHWPEHYSQDDIGMIGWINEQLSRRGISVNGLSRGARRGESTIKEVLGGSYGASPTGVLRSCRDYLTGIENMAGVQAAINRPTVHTSVYKIVRAACRRAQVYRGFSVVSAIVGTGKTHALHDYVRNNPGTVLVQAIPMMNVTVLLDEIVRATGAVVQSNNRFTRGTNADKMTAILDTMRGSDRLLIVDEAETLSPNTLEYIRRIRDLANVGVVLSGTEKLQIILRNKHGRFGQISSRVNYWARTVRSITQQDVELLAREYLADQHKALTADVLDALWQASDGSARVLVEGIIPGLRDYVLSEDQPLTGEAVHAVATDILGYQ